MFSKIKNNLPKILNILVYATIFLSFVFPYRDKDWGWHFQYGKYLFEHGQILRTDIFSWTMTGFPWSNHEWLFDPIIYLIFKYSGYIGASLAGAIVTFFCFWLLVKKFNLSYWKLAIAGFLFSQMLEVGIREGLRAQVLALLPLTLVIYLLMQAEKNFKKLWLIPPVMLLFVNVHGTFAYGLLVIAVFFGVWFFKYPKLRWQLIGVGLLSLLATLFNPYVLGVYYDVIIHSTSPYLKNVFEWLPITQNCSYCNVPSFLIYLILIAIAFIESPSVQNLPFLILSLILIIPTFTYRRNLPTFTVVTFPLFISWLSNLKFDLTKFKITPFVFAVSLIAIIEFVLFSQLPAFNYYKYGEFDYCNFASQCSVELTNFMKQYPPEGNGFNFYDWGGYLIGKEVPFKLFIDGRMHLWQTSDGYMPFADTIAIYYTPDIEKFNSYDFDWVLAQPNAPISRAIIEKKVKGNWIIKYQDQWAVYFINAKIR